jgi:hypothetical protein
MRIVSKQKDFYDYADGWSAEPVYVREERRIPFEFRVSWFFGLNVPFIVRVGDIQKICVTRTRFDRATRDYITSVRWCNEIDEILPINGPGYHDNCGKLFAMRDLPKLDGDCPIECLYLNGRHSERISNPNLSERLNPELFFLTPTQVCQEVSRWLFNRTDTGRVIPPIDDVTLAEAKGYNKWSFRKEPHA